MLLYQLVHDSKHELEVPFFAAHNNEGILLQLGYDPSQLIVDHITSR